MNNRDKAAHIIDQWTQEGYELNSAVGSPHAITERLADAGLLAPDLPEASKANFVPDGKEWLPGGPHGPSIWTAPDSTVMVQRLEPGDLTPEEAREVAHALLAAANFSEGKGNQE